MLSLYRSRDVNIPSALKGLRAESLRRYYESQKSLTESQYFDRVREMTSIRVQDKSLPSPWLDHTLSQDVRSALSVENAGSEEQKQVVVNR